MPFHSIRLAITKQAKQMYSDTPHNICFIFIKIGNEGAFCLVYENSNEHKQKDSVTIPENSINVAFRFSLAEADEVADELLMHQKFFRHSKYY